MSNPYRFKDGRILLNSNVNYMLVRDAILDALESAGFTPMWFGMIAMLPPVKEVTDE